MKRNLNIKEVLAWILLVFAAFLFTATMAFAQDKKKGSTTVKIIKKENGKTTKIDTTFDSNDEEALRKILKDLDLDHDMSFSFSVPEPPDGSGDRHIRKFQYNGLSKKEREKLKEEMENLKDEMKDLHEQLKDIHIEIFSNKDGDDGEGYSYSFSTPPMPPTPPGQGDRDFFDDHAFKKMRHHGFSLSIPDSLDDDDHLVIMGEDGETPPVFEKEITGKHGEKIFIYKRSKTAEGKAKAEAAASDRIKLYPNPNDGKFSVTYHADQTHNLTVRVYDPQGKEVYTETMKDFSGDYVNQFDLSSKGKGNYILKITHGNQTSIEKFVIE